MVRFFATLGAERDRWALWIPVFFGAGIGLYFALPSEPGLLTGPAFLVAGGALAWAGYRGRETPAGTGLAVLGTAAAIVAAGTSAAQLRTASLDTVMLNERVGPTTAEGRVVRVESFPDSVRIVLDRPHIWTVAPHTTPQRIRIRVRAPGTVVRPGDWVRVRVIVSPPSPPAAPGAFDFQRHAYFQGIGGVGFALGGVDVTSPPDVPARQRLALHLAALRTAVTARIRASLPGDSGGVAAALITGERSAVPEPVLADIRDSGLAHLLSISGLHIGLVAGILFAAVRAGLALIPAVALRYPVKKWAAVVAILGAFAYALLAGATLPTQRAFLMIGLALLGVILDRRGLSLRSVAWASMVILIVQPESLIGASFQMSFAAVIALIAGYEYLSHRRQAAGAAGYQERGLGRTMARYLAGIALTTIIAGAATAPFAVYHFNRIADYGVIANLIAVPVTGLWVMPWAIVALIVMPVGGEAAALTAMGWGIEIIVGVAAQVARWPGAVTLVPLVPIWGLIAVTLGGLWLCLWRGRWRRWGVIGMAVGLLSVATQDPPDILMDGSGRLLAIRGQDNQLLVSSRRGARFQRELWSRMLGDDRPAERFPVAGATLSGRLSCDIQGCVFRKGARTAAIVRNENAAMEDCGRVDVIVSLIPLRRKCRGSLTLDRFDLWRAGAHAIWLDGNGLWRRQGIVIRSVVQSRGRRPWVPNTDRPAVPQTPGS